MNDEEYLKHQTDVFLKRHETIADRHPALAYLGVVLVVVSYLSEIFFAGGWILRVLEIPSIYDQLLPGWSAFECFGAVISVSLITYLLTKFLKAGNPL